MCSINVIVLKYYRINSFYRVYGILTTGTQFGVQNYIYTASL